jgi:histidinol dehydrogenase
MLAKRIIPCLDVRDGKVVKGIQFRDHHIVGDIVNLATFYSNEGADELVFYDITASSEDRTVLTTWISQVATCINIPFTVAGGIRDLSSAQKLLNAGADKVSINSPALEHPDLINELSKVLGNQCIVIGIDSQWVEDDYYVYQYTGDVSKSKNSWRRTKDWVQEVQDRGAGEIVLNCMQSDGIRRGFDLAQLQKIRSVCQVPLVASGGAGSLEDFACVFQEANADAALAASVFHQKVLSIHDVKDYLLMNNIPVRHTTKPQNRMVNTADGVSVEQIYRPIDKIGLYVPGGNNTPLISSLLMQAIPAEIAGCPIKILCTPPNSSGEIDPALLVAARLCNIETVYPIGGAQAIAAMAYGTESITKVNKLFGPGNAYVTEAKSQVAFDPLGAAIDLPAGPSEVMIMADSAANPQFIAADLLAQAEHGPDSQVFLVCDNLDLADNVRLEVREQAGKAKRKSIIVQALAYGAIILCDNHEDQLKIINSYAPEHLIINRTDAHDWVANITSAGSIFEGPWAAETMGDYITGSNHVLPTYGHAKAYSGLSCRDFLKCISVQSIKASGITALGPSAVVLANLEGLEAHAHAVQIRLQALLEDTL